MPTFISRSCRTRVLYPGSLIRAFLLFICMYVPLGVFAQSLQQPGSASGTRELVIIGGSLQDQQVLKNAAREGMEVAILKGGQPALKQISDVLAGYANLDAVHLVTHGSAGAVELNGEVLDQRITYQEREMITAWGKALKENGDFLLYGCKIAEGRVGKAYVGQLANLTGADFAASEDLTGARSKDGDWDLEYKLGEIQARALVVSDYQHTLQATPGDGLYTFQGAVDNGGGTYKTKDGFFKISAMNGSSGVNPPNSIFADEFGAFINDGANNTSGTSSIEVRVLNGGSFNVTSAVIGDYDLGTAGANDFFNIYAVGLSGNAEVARTPSHDSRGRLELNYNLDFSSFAGKTIDAFRVYYSWGSGTSQQAFNLESISIKGASSTPPPPANAAPTATAVSTTGTLKIGQVLTGSYTYADAENNAESGSTFKWYRSDNSSGLNKMAIASATTKTYTLQAADLGKYISFEVTPKDGTTAGAPVESTRRGPVASIVVTDAHISISGASGTGGAFRIGDVVTATWNNSATGDNNSGITTVTVNFSQFGGGAAVAGTNNSGTWTAIYTILPGSVDGTNRNVSITATDGSASTTTADGTNTTVDNMAPVITDQQISISGATGISGTFKIGDVVTATWNNSATGDNNSDQISSVTVDFTSFGGGAAVTATNSSGTWTATYTITAGSIDGTNRNISVTATDNAGNTTTAADGSNASVDNVAPALTDAKISVSGASGISGAFIAGDVLTVTWNNTAAGDNNVDVISAVTVDFSQFGGGAAVAGTNSSGTWTATYTIPSGSISANPNVSVTATDNAGNSKTVADATNPVVDNSIPAVTSVAVPANGTYKAGAVLSFTVNYSEPVTVSGIPNLGLTIGSTSVQAAYANGSGTTALTFAYTVGAGTLDPNGITIGALSLNGGTMRDARGNHATLTLNSVSSTAAVLVDGVLPTSAITISKSELKAGETAVVTITFSEAVTGLTSSDLTVENGTLTSLSSSDGGKTWTGTLTPATGITDASNTISLDNTGIQDAAGNAGTGVTVSGNYRIDTQLASVTLVEVPNPGTYVAGHDLDFNVTFDKDITVNTAGGTPSLGLTLSGAGGTVLATYHSGSGSSSLNFRYRVVSGNLDGDGPQIAAAISLHGGTLLDASGNPVNVGLNNVASTSGIIIDAVAPATPTALQATAGDGKVTISWAANTEADLKSYNLYGGPEANSTHLIQAITPPTTTYTQSGLTNGLTYTYRVTATDKAGNTSPVTADASAVPKSAQTITFNALSGKTYGDTDFEPGATASSNLAVTYTSGNTAVATVVSGKIHIVGVGSAVITASQAGNASYLAATQVTQTLTVSAKPLTVSLNATPAVTKVYDGTTGATLAAGNYTLTGVLGGEEVTVSGTATYDTKTAGTGKTITVTGFVLAGAQKDNYTVSTTTATTTGSITQKPVTLALNATPAITKVYDGTTGATLAPGNYTLNNVESGDEVTVSGTATYDTKTAGTGKTITVNTFVLGGAQKDNYTLTTTTASTTGAITAKPITLALNATPAITKVYNGDNAATLAIGNYTLNGLETGDEVTVSGTAVYDTKNTGTGKTITVNSFTLAGAQKDNYALSTTTASTTGSITAKPITLTLNAGPAISKAYDGGTGVTLIAGNYTLNGLETGDEVTVSGTAAYDTKVRGTGKTITVNSFILGGAQKDNYSLTTTSATTTGSITAKSISLALNAAPSITKVYDGSTTATLATGNYTLTGVETGDEVTVSGTAAYDTRNAGSGKTVTASMFLLAGAEKENYTLTTTTATTTGSITAKPITVSLNAAPAITRAYDGATGATLAAGNYTLNDLVTGDDVTVSGTAAYDSRTTGTGKTVTVNSFVLAGAQKDNYTVTTTTATTTGSVTAKPITVSLNASPAITRGYDGTTGATLVAGNYILNGVETGDEVSVSGTATYDNKSMGTGKTVTVNTFVLAGAQKDNYSLTTTTATTTGSITGKAITLVLNAMPAISKVYDGTTGATLAAGNYILSGVETGDDVTVTGTAAFDTKHTGSGKTITVNSFVLAGAQKDNYTLSTTTATTTGSITAKPITLAMNAAPAITKVYDGATGATLAARNYTLTGLETGDEVTVSGSAAFDTKTTGSGKTITVNSFVLAGAQKDNYSLTTITASTTGSITAKPITLTLNVTPAITKVYDGATTATLAAGNYMLNDLETGDEVTVTGTAAYDTKNMGAGKTITVTGFVLAGAQKDNYALTTTTATTTGSITGKPITLSLNASPDISRVYDGTTTATLAAGNYTLNNVESGDEVTVSGTASYDSRNAGTGKTISVNGFVLAGAQKDNYTLTTTTATTTGAITGKYITVSLNATPAIIRAYNYTIHATLAPGNFTLNDVVAGDEVTVSGMASYDNRHTGAGKTVTGFNFELAGAQKDNYLLTTREATTTGSVTPKPITLALKAAPAIKKVYDGNNQATLAPANYTLSGIEGYDDVAASGTATYADPNAGSGKTITANTFVLSGDHKDNYTLTTTSAEVTGEILKKEVTPSLNAVPAIVKEYDGDVSAPLLAANFALAGVVGNDEVGLKGLALFDTRNVGVSKVVKTPELELTGAKKDNYRLTTNEAFTTGTITTRTLTVKADHKTKYQGTENPELTLTYEGFVNSENATVLTTKPVLSTTAMTSSAIGEYPIEVSGGSAVNYQLKYEAAIMKVVPGAPTSVSVASVVIFENRPAGTAAGTLSSTSLDPNATFTFALTSGEGDNDNKLFTIAGNQLKTAAKLDYEQKNTYRIRVRSTTQYGFSLDQVFDIKITDVNEAPTISAIPDETICYTTAPMVVQVNGLSAGPERNQSNELSVKADNTDLFDQLIINSNGKLTYSVKPGKTGRAIITVTIVDNGGTDNGGENTFSRTFTLTVNPLPVVTITSDKGTSISKGESVQLTATGGSSYDWGDAEGITGSRKMQTLTVRPSVTTTYRVLVTTAAGCQAEKEITIEVRDDYQVVTGTNLVSPNGDGVNDRLIIRNIDMYPNNVVKIYDRGGRLLYSKTNYTDEWDGTFQGSPLAEGTYYYIVDFGKRQLKGFITIVRD